MKFLQEWQGVNCAEPNAPFPARVPGNIQADYAAARGFADYQYADNYKQFLPLEDVDWEYRAVLRYEKKPGDRVFFVSGGIDYIYRIALNGEELLSYEGMFRPVELDLTDRLTGRDDLLTVHICKHPKSAGSRPGTRDEADDSCKPPACYGWDWNPRLLVSGMWLDAFVETRDASYIGDCEALAKVSDDLSLGTVAFSYTCSVPCEVALFDPAGREVYRGNERQVCVKDPELWWCAGQGEPNLYRWEIRNAGAVREGTVGFRRLRLVRNKPSGEPKLFPKSRYYFPITVELNNRRIFANGSNWVAPDVFMGNMTAERYEELLTLVRGANMNILRVWGGSGICKPEFYDLCDRLGIMVWQEFMLACNNYKATPHYMSVLQTEAPAIVRALRHHPSLAFWCGGNELFNSWSGMDDHSHVLRYLNKLLFEMDYDRPFLPTSPLVGTAHGGYEFYNPKYGEVFEIFQKSSMGAYTEFGVPSISSVENLRRAIPEAELFPPSRTPAWIAHHGFDAWGPDTWLTLNTIVRYFPKIRDLNDLVEKSAWLQCEGYRAAFEEMRRQWPACSMAINWCYNEPWITAGNNSLVEYPAKPKKAYYAVASALRPSLFSAKIAKFNWFDGETFEAELWLLNNSPEQVTGTVRAILTVDGKDVELLSWTAAAEPNANFRGPTVRAILPPASGSSFTFRLVGTGDLSNEYCLRLDRKPPKQPKPIPNLG